jgi:hypothetical protein
MGNKIMRKNRWLYPVILIVIGALVVCTGCNKYHVMDNNSHKTFVMNRGVAKFSFDFSPKYRVTGAVVESTCSDITLRGPELDQAGNSTVFSASVCKTVYQDYQSSIETLLSMVKGGPDFKLLERSSVTISGEQGEELVYYSLQAITNEAIAEGIQPVHMITRHLEFMQNGLSWALDISSLESSVEEDKANYEQIVRTFKILD